MGSIVGEKQADDLFLIQIHLFRLTQKKWNLADTEKYL